MSAYIIRRLLMLPILLLGVSILIFLMMSLLTPYERVSLYVPDFPKRAGALEELIEKYGLNDPIFFNTGKMWEEKNPLALFESQYFRWMGKVLRGDLGFSKVGKRPVTEALLYYFPTTAELALWCIVPLIGVGIWLGIQSAIHHNTLIDHVTRVFSIIGWSFPTFVFGLLVLMLFYAKLEWFPPSRLSDWANQIVISPEFTRYTSMNTLDALLNGRLDIFWDALRHLVLPVITLSYLSWALILRVTRSSMLEVLRQDYVTTARAKGLKEKAVINKHARPNAMIPVATVGGIMLLNLASGVVITETVFNYRGMGWFIAHSAIHLDVISVMGFALFNGVLIVLGNLAVDILYAFLDPRVRLR
jgi:peptide/nickel transport system permease protein